MEKFTIDDFNKMFPDDDTCLEWLKNYLYPDGIFCETCQRITKHHRVASRRSYSCDYCGHHVHPMAGTIYEKSTTPLRIWFYATYLMASTRCGISAKQIQRETGVTYKTAWRMFKQIRSLLEEEGTTLTGEVEADETYIGGKDGNRHASKRSGGRGRGNTGKTIVAGTVERKNGKGRVIAKVIPDVQAQTLLPLIQANVAPASVVYTDEHHGYNRVAQLGYDHRRIYHASKVYVLDNVHTNTIEGFWSLVKRGIGGVYHAVSPKYLQDYVNEYSFRYSHRKDERPMFLTFLGQIQKA